MKERKKERKRRKEGRTEGREGGKKVKVLNSVSPQEKRFITLQKSMPPRMPGHTHSICDSVDEVPKRGKRKGTQPRLRTGLSPGSHWLKCSKHPEGWVGLEVIITITIIIITNG